MDTGRRNLNLSRESLGLGNLQPIINQSNSLPTFDRSSSTLYQTTVDQGHRRHAATCLDNKLLLADISTSSRAQSGCLKSSVLSKHRSIVSAQYTLIGFPGTRNDFLAEEQRSKCGREGTFAEESISKKAKRTLDDDSDMELVGDDQGYHFDWPSVDAVGSVGKDDEMFRLAEERVSERTKRLMEIRKAKNDFVNGVSSSLIRAPNLKMVEDPVRQDLLRFAAEVCSFDPEFVLKMALYARQELNIRSTCNLLLAYAAFNTRCRPFLRRYFDASVVLPSDWIDVAEFYKLFGEKCLPVSLRKALTAKFSQFDEYQLGKYNKTKKKKKKKGDGESDAPVLSTYTLKQLIRKLHIKDPAEYVMGLIGKRYPADIESFRRSRLSGTWDPTRAGERMKLAIPQTWETELSANKNSNVSWERLIDNKKLPYMAMLRNVRNLILAGISEDHHVIVLKQLSNKWAVIKSRQFPHRFLAAQHVVKELIEKYDIRDDLQCNIRRNIHFMERKLFKLNKKFKYALTWWKCKTGMLEMMTRYQSSLDRAMEIAAFFNVPPIEGATLVLVDVSYNMCITSFTAKGLGNLNSICDLAMLLSQMCTRVCEQSVVQLFYEGEKPNYSESGITDKMITVERLDDLLLTMHIRDKKKINNLVVFTSNEEIGIIKHFVSKYRLQVNSKLLYINVGMASSRTNVALCGNEENSVHLSGFSESILRFIAERGGGGRLCYIDRIDVKYNLKPLPKPPLRDFFNEVDVSLPPTVEGVAAPKWRTLRVFISSTFMDMHGERDLLIRYIFPELRSRAKSLFLDVHDVDLRWGITEEANNDSALEVCLSEISKCQLFIGILGERYGTVLSSHDSCVENEEFSWLAGYPTGSSITELEFHYAALANPKASKDRAFFFLRDDTFVQNIPKEFRKQFVETSVDGAAKLNELKDKVRQSGLEVFDGYPCEWKGVVDDKPMVGNLEMFGQRVLNNLWNALMKLHVDQGEEEVVIVEESVHHVAFAKRAHDTFVGRGKLMETFKAALLDVDNGVVLVSGKPGIGKTAIMGHLGCILQDEFLVIFCFAGATNSTANSKGILSFLCDQLRHVARHCDVEVPAEHRGSVSEFKTLLNEVHKLVEKLFIFIDGLDILEESQLNKVLEWLNLGFPKSVVFVCSAPDNGLLRKGLIPTAVKILSVVPMEMSDRVQLARQFLAKHRKFLDESSFNNQLRSLVSKFESGLPLYVYLSCEELRSFGIFEKVTEHIAEMSSSVEGLFKSSLTQLETDFGEELIEGTLGIITICKEGLHQEDVYQLLGMQRTFMNRSEVQLEEVRWWVLTPDVAVPRAVFTNMMRALHIMLETQDQSADSILRVPHRKAVTVIRGRYSKTVFSIPNEKKMHRLLAGYFWSLADVRNDGSWIGNNTRALSSMVSHLLAGGCYEAAEDVLCNLNFIRSKFETGLHQQLIEEYVFAGAIDTLTRLRGVVARRSPTDRDRLKRFELFVSRNVHILNETPHLTHQQALNESEGSVVQTQARRSLEELTKVGRVRPVLVRWRNKPDIDDDLCQMTLTLSKAIRTAAFSPHGDLVCVGEANVVRLYSTDSGKEARSFTGHMDTVTQVLFLSNAKLCSASLDTTISIWDVQEGHRLSVLCGHTRPVSAVCCDTTGKTLVSVGWDSTVRLWSTNTGKEISVIAPEKQWSPFNCVAFHPQRQLAVTGSWDGVINIWDLVTMKRSSTLQGHSSSVRSVDVSPYGTYVVSTSLDCTLRIWSFEHGYQVSSVCQAFPFASAIFSPSGNHVVAVGTSRTVKIYSATIGETMSRANVAGNASLTSILFQPDGLSVICGFSDGSCNKVDISTGRKVSDSKCGSSSITCMCSLPDNSSVVVVGMETGSLLLVNAEGKHLKTLVGHTSAVTAVSSSSEVVVSGSERGQLVCHRSPERARVEMVDPLFVLDIHCGAVTSIAFKWDGVQFATTSADQTAQVWSSALVQVLQFDPTVAFEPSLRVDCCHSEKITSCCWVEDFETNHLLVTAGLDLSVCAWNSASGQCAWKKTGLDAPVTFLSSSRTLVITGALNGNIEMWSPEGVSISTISGSGESAFSILFPPADSSKPTSPLVPDNDVDDGLSARIRQLQTAVDRLQEVIFVRSTASGLIEFVEPCFSKEKETLFGHSDDVLSVCCSADGRVVTASSDKTVRIWKPSALLDVIGSRSKILTGEPRHFTEVTSLTYCKLSGMVATGDRHGAVIVWTMDPEEKRWRAMAQISTAHKKSVTSIVFCSVRDHVFATGSDDTSVILWNYCMYSTTANDGVDLSTQPLRGLLSTEPLKSNIEWHYDICLLNEISIGSQVICMACVLESNALFVGTTKGRIITVDLQSTETKSSLTYVNQKDADDDDDDKESEQSFMHPNDSSIKSWILTLTAIGEIGATNSRLFLSNSFGEIAAMNRSEDISEEVPQLIATMADLKKRTDDSPIITDTKHVWPTALDVKFRYPSSVASRKSLPTFFVGTANGEIVVHDSNSSSTHSVTIPGGMVRGLSFIEMRLGDSSIVCTGSEDGLVRIWKMSNSSYSIKQIGQFNCKAPVMHLTSFCNVPKGGVGDSEITIVCGDLLGNVYFLETENFQNYI